MLGNRLISHYQNHFQYLTTTLVTWTYLFYNCFTIICSVQFSSVQSLSCVRLCNPMDCSTPGLPVHHQLLEFTQTLMSIESVMPSNQFILCRPLFLLPSIFPSIRVFSNESVLHIRWPKYWSFSFGISPSNEYSALISFRLDWLDLLAEMVLALSSKNFWKLLIYSLAFFIVQLSYSYMTPEKTIALTRWTFVGKAEDF